MRQSSSKPLNHVRPLGAKPGIVTATIAGVVPDFPVTSIHEPIEPTVFYVQPELFRLLSIKLAGESVPETLDGISARVARGGRSEAHRPVLLRSAHAAALCGFHAHGDSRRDRGGVAILIACLGLLGLASYLAERRRKEMGIRKASGAGKADIFRLMPWELVRPVVWANLIAWPVAYLILSRWLSGMAYHIDLGIGLFAAAGSFAVAIAFATVGQQAWSVARGRAMAALRHE